MLMYIFFVWSDEKGYLFYKKKYGFLNCFCEIYILKCVWRFWKKNFVLKFIS